MSSLQAMKSNFEDYNSSDGSSSDDEFLQILQSSQRKVSKRRQQRNTVYHWRNDKSIESLDSYDSSNYNDVNVTSRSIPRYSNSRLVRKNSMEAVKESLMDRRRALKKIQETWFTFDDDSTDFSDDSCEWSSSSSLQDLVVKCDVHSASDESSGYSEGSFESSSKGSLSGTGLSSDGYGSESDCKCCETSGICKARTEVESESISMKGRQLNFDIFSRGFGSNKWYKRKQRNKVEIVSNRDSGVSLEEYEKYMDDHKEQFINSKHKTTGFGTNNWYRL